MENYFKVRRVIIEKSHYTELTSNVGPILGKEQQNFPNLCNRKVDVLI